MKEMPSVGLTIAVLLVPVVVLLASLLVSLLLRSRKERLRQRRPCYRCGTLATEEFMNLPYCYMCREVVIRVYPSVSFDPPYGFPGGAGYTGFQGMVDRKKKES